jgi:hypothetical protein
MVSIAFIFASPVSLVQRPDFRTRSDACTRKRRPASIGLGFNSLERLAPMQAAYPRRLCAQRSGATICVRFPQAVPGRASALNLDARRGRATDARYGPVHGGCDAVVMAPRCVDALAFSSAWMAFAAAALVAASSRALEVPVDARALGLAFAGTFVVYNLDRLRDLERDRRTAPLRTAFVVAHQTALVRASLAALLLALLLLAFAGVRAGVLLLPALALGLAHRRLKHIAFFKPVYIAVAWLIVVVGLPWCLAAGAGRAVEPAQVGWLSAVLAASILSNAIAANVREAGAARIGAQRALGVARGLAAAGVACAVLAPASVRTLVAVPAATFAALAAFRGSERYGLVIVDGALLVGALAALVLPAS